MARGARLGAPMERVVGQSASAVGEELDHFGRMRINMGGKIYTMLKHINNNSSSEMLLIKIINNGSQLELLLIFYLLYQQWF
jgi:hypothetical protein